MSIRVYQILSLSVIGAGQVPCFQVMCVSYFGLTPIVGAAREVVAATDPSFAPSRGRALPSTDAMAVAGSQPSGRALPSLIAGAPATPVDHVRAAMAVSPVASLVNDAVPGKAKVVLSEIIRDPTAVVARRVRDIATFRDVCVRGWGLTALLGPGHWRWIPPRGPSTCRCCTFW